MKENRRKVKWRFNLKIDMLPNVKFVIILECSRVNKRVITLSMIKI